MTGCAERVFADRWGSSPCSRKGVVEEAGKWWCKQHAPSAVETRRKAADERYEAKRAAIKAAQVKRYSIAELRELLAEYIRTNAHHIVVNENGLYAPDFLLWLEHPNAFEEEAQDD